MSRAIPPDLEPEVLKKYGEGLRSRKIAEWLKAEHGVECSHAAVARIVKHARTERADVAKEVVRERLAKTLTSDLDVLEEQREKVRKLADRLFDAAMVELPDDIDPVRRVEIQAARLGVGELYLKAVDRIAKVVDLKLHYAGADAPDDVIDEVASAEQSLVRRMDSLAERVRPREAPEGDRSDPAGEGGT